MCRILGAFFSWSTFWYLCNLRGYRQSQVLHCKMRGTLASEVFHAKDQVQDQFCKITSSIKMDCVCNIVFPKNEKLAGVSGAGWLRKSSLFSVFCAEARFSFTFVAGLYCQNPPCKVKHHQCAGLGATIQEISCGDVQV